MNAGLKQRLVGAVVLVALAVIFLPMLLDGSGARERSSQDIQIPEKPESPESQLGERDADAEAGGGDESTAAASLDDAPEADEDASTTATASTESTDTASADGASSGAADHSGQAEADQASETDKAEANAPESGWIVQVGSFRRETNALVLRDKLRESGFDSQTERVQSDERTLWRVLVGPVAERGDGEALQRRIEEQRDGDTLLMKYP